MVGWLFMFVSQMMSSIASSHTSEAGSIARVYDCCPESDSNFGSSLPSGQSYVVSCNISRAIF